ncbi:MAG: response regulator [Asticcacaulis sp.]
MTKLMDRLRAARVLLVEDNRGDAVLTRRAFKRAQINSEITVAETGEKGLSILRREGDHAGAERPDIILLDLNLPYMHGRDFLKTVKSDPDFKRIPVIVLSSSSAENDINSSYDRHASGFITKPVNNDVYEDIVTRISLYWFDLMQLPPDQSAPQFS